MSTRNAVIKKGRHLHRALLWPAMLAMFTFILSGFTHPLLTWTGPQAAKNYPPKAAFSNADIAGIAATLQQHNIVQAAIIKVVPTARGNLLQVTQDALQPRRYFDSALHTEIQDFDREHAVWLARYYTGLSETPVAHIELLTAFNDQYPWVNRLLPVYRITFTGDNALTVYIHTETGALADISNSWKRTLQTVFQQLHTFKWLDFTGHGRIALMMILLSSLLGMTLAGASLLLAIKKRNIPSARRRWHRYLAHIVWIPLFGFTASGIYHLLYQQYSDNSRGARIGEPVNLAEKNLSANFAWLDALQGQALNSISLIATPDKGLFYRISFPTDNPQHKPATRNQRFDGIASENPALYINAISGEHADLDDERFTGMLAARFLHLSPEQLSAGEKITRFGPNYDFRNKRLPAWQFQSDTADQSTVFIDPATGLLIDTVPLSARYEGISFALLHKWNFLTHSIGREKRDALMVLILSLALVLALLGYRTRRP